ncbi:pyruvate, water dikinase regulatory protein [Paremcibacter congregatus]|uniref:pyruvate, water dikinase regulatory protein n=1 Tax=Paremcibacter congregatus TaxID=2043170 RepID=UPI0030EED955|tara:strand:- start:2900 stop:3733 length:834 start_codon:yes stop_codon:yes gene_type:complete
MKEVHLHLVSDATGDTLEQVAKAALAQFPEFTAKKHYWPMIRTARHMERLIPELAEKPGIVMFTLVNQDIEKVLIHACEEHNWPYISVLHGIIRELGRHLGAKSIARPGLQHKMNDEYFERIDAMQYTLLHDDGQYPEGLKEADIILVGVSRTSKTPTCVYLANKGMKTANVPIVPNQPLPKELENTEGKFVVGLVNSVDRLVQIRRNRLLSLKEEKETTYVDEDHIKQEVQQARRLMTSRGWPVIDVTRRSIEETAGAIMKLKYKFDDDKEKDVEK